MASGSAASASGAGAALNPFGSNRPKAPASIRRNIAEIIGFLRANRGRQAFRTIESRLNKELEGVDAGIEANAALCDELRVNPKVIWHDSPQPALEYRPTYGMVKNRTDLITLLWNAALAGIVWDDLSDAYDAVDDDIRALFKADKIVAVHHDSVALIHDDSTGKAPTAAASAAAIAGAPSKAAAEIAAKHAAKQRDRVSKQDQLVEQLLVRALSAAEREAKRKNEEKRDALAGTTAAEQRKRKQLADAEQTKLKRAVSLFWRERRLPGGAGYSAAVLEAATAKHLELLRAGGGGANEPAAKRVKTEGGGSAAAASGSGSGSGSGSAVDAATAAALAEIPIADQEVALDADVRALWTAIAMPQNMQEMEKVLAAKGHLSARDASSVTKAAMAQVATLAKPKARKKPVASRPIKLTNIHLVNTYDWLRPQAAAAGLHIPNAANANATAAATAAGGAPGAAAAPAAAKK